VKRIVFLIPIHERIMFRVVVFDVFKIKKNSLIDFYLVYILKETQKKNSRNKLVDTVAEVLNQQLLPNFRPGNVSRYLRN